MDGVEGIDAAARPSISKRRNGSRLPTRLLEGWTDRDDVTVKNRGFQPSKTEYRADEKALE